MRPSSICLIALIFLVAVSSVAPLAADDHVVYGADSPQALVERLEKAVAGEDIAEIVRCIEPEARQETTTMMIAMPAMIIAFSSMGSGMASAMGEAMGEALGGEQDAEAQAKLAAEQEAAAAKTEAMTAKFEALLGRYGLDGMVEQGLDGAEGADQDEAAFAALLDKIDQGALVADTLAFMEVEFPDEGSGGASAFQLPGEISDLQVDGDSATVTAGEETVSMVKIDGRWYLVGDQDLSGGE